MTTLDSLSETIKNYRGIEEETKSENSDKSICDVLTFGDVSAQERQGHELPYSDGQRRTFSYKQ